MSDLFDVAVSCWRLEKWINNIQVDRKMAAMNSIRRIKAFLNNEGIEIIDFTGQPYDVSFPVIVVNDADITDDCIIVEMSKPVILSKDGKGLEGEAYVGQPVLTISEEKDYFKESVIVEAEQNKIENKTQKISSKSKKRRKKKGRK